MYHILHNIVYIFIQLKTGVVIDEHEIVKTNLQILLS